MAEEPCKGVGSAIIEILAILLTRDNLVILSMAVIVIYAIYTYGQAQAGTAEKLALVVLGGFAGYLGKAIQGKTEKEGT